MLKMRGHINCLLCLHFLKFYYWTCKLLIFLQYYQNHKVIVRVFILKYTHILLFTVDPQLYKVKSSQIHPNPDSYFIHHIWNIKKKIQLGKLKCLCIMLPTWLLVGVWESRESRISINFDWWWLTYTIRAEIRKMIDISFCGSAKTASINFINIKIMLRYIILGYILCLNY